MENGETTHYLALGHKNLYEKTGTVATKHIFAGTQRIAEVKDGVVSYCHNDHLGSPRAVTNASGTLIATTGTRPFGQPHSTNNPTDYLFTGKELDDTGLYYFAARYYDPSVGRFVTEDSWQGKLEEPWTQNRYVYVGNNPLKYVDPTGNVPKVIQYFNDPLDWRHLDKTGQPSWIKARIEAAELKYRIKTEQLSWVEKAKLTARIVWLEINSQPPLFVNMSTNLGDVNLASEQRTAHILFGDKTGGGHMWPRSLGKTAFPESWSAGKIMKYVSDIVTDPSLTWKTGRMIEGIQRYEIVGIREGIAIKVITDGFDIITAFPIR